MKAFIVFVASLALWQGVGFSAATNAEKKWEQPVSLNSGMLVNPTAEIQVRTLGVLSAPSATRVRVAFATIELGLASKVRVVSLLDQQSHTLDGRQVAEWSSLSGIFNGNKVRVEVLLAPGDSAQVTLKKIIAFSPQFDAARAGESCCGDRETETLCGPDNRVASGDNRVGRINGGCTGWLTANGAVLTAGHCSIAAGSVFEVNVPASQANGATVASAIQDQYAVLANSITTVNNGVGSDYTVCRIGPNSLGLFAHRQYGFFRMTRELPGGGGGLRVTGCGIDNSPQGSQPNVCGNRDSAGNCTHFGLNAQNQTLQTSTGTFTGETGGASLQYAVDTEPANSGSPIIWEATGFTIGIHTAGGCTAAGGANNGTSFEVDGLEFAIAGIPGLGVMPNIGRANIRYLDSILAPGNGEDGTRLSTARHPREAINAVPAGGLLSITAGTYSASGARTINKRMTIRAPVGNVLLGN